MSEWLYGFLISQVLAPAIAMDLPSLVKLEVTDVSYHPRGKAHNLVVYTEDGEAPARVIIGGEAKFRSPHRGSRRFHIVIDTERDLIIRDDWSAIIGYEYYGSAGIGIVILGAPALLLTLPVIVSSYLLFWLLGGAVGMNHHALFAYCKLRKQLDPATRSFLWRALKNRFNGVEDAYIEERSQQYLEYRAKRRAKNATLHVEQ